MCYPGRRKFSFRHCPGLLMARFLFRHLRTDCSVYYMIIIIITIMQPIAIISHLTVFTIIFRLKKGSFRWVLSITVRDTRSQTNHSVIETENRLTGYKIGRKVLIITFHQLHSEHPVFAVQRITSGEVLFGTRHSSSLQRTIKQLKG